MNLPRQQHSALRPILVIEDNDMDIDFCIQAFETHAVANPVITCRDGEEALNFIDTHPSSNSKQFPLLVLLDLSLPKVDGIDVLRHARQLPEWKKVPFIILTTSRENDDISAAYELGANAYILKPVDFDSFTEVIKSIKMFWVLTNESTFAPLVQK